MPRSVRIEYPGALYHVMARGNRRADIFLDDGDRELFLATLAQACERTGWRVLAWVLMSNHYHLAFQTPEPNLVAGMTWLQTTYTRRFNTRHQLWGRLFGDRYKAIPVEDTAADSRSPVANRPADYLTALVDYIHLNPVRARLVDPARKQSVLDYPWSSVARGYALPPSKRQSRWLDVEWGLSLVDSRDVSRDRRGYVERLDRRAAAEEAIRCGLPEAEAGEKARADSRALQAGLRRGWFWGSDRFRERLLDLAGKANGRKRTFRRTEAGRDHNEQTAEEILRMGLDHFGIADEEVFRSLTGRGDLRRAAVAWAIWRHSSVPQGWTAKHLNLRSAANASQQIRRFRSRSDRELPVAIRRWKKEVSRIFT